MGAEVQPRGGVHFRVWAPRSRKVEVVLESGAAGELAPAPGGYFSGLVPEAAPGALYRYRLEGGPELYPDPASRFQPDGPHGASEVIDPGAFSWTDQAWRGVSLPGQVIYEMHVGTFTREGTYAAAALQLPELARLGVTVLELMPVADFVGRFGWGYDGVDLYAPTHLYGRPDDLRRFVDRAHALSIGVILDVVYNHVGPDGCYLTRFSGRYFTRKYEIEWGEAINFDDEDSGPVREFFIANAAYWIDEYHLDGLRLDATQSIHDTSPTHVLAEIAASARRAAGSRGIILVAENEPQHTDLVRPASSCGCGLDALWNDDFHHSAMAALTGRNEAYYHDYAGSPQEFISAAKYGYLYQGQFYSWQGKRRGQPSTGLSPGVFVNYIQNHDQVANSGRGERVSQLTDPGRLRAMTALLLLAPGTPMLFQGQEFAASSPFFYFADHDANLAGQVGAGRIEFLAQFRSLALPEMKDVFRDPHDPATFEHSKLDFAGRERNAPVYLLHQDLLRLRREDPAFRAQRAGAVDGAVLGPEVFVLRFFVDGPGDRLLLVNLGLDRYYRPAPEPLLAPPAGLRWTKLWSTEEPRYHGCGCPPLEFEGVWSIPGHAAVVLAPAPPTAADLRRERRLEQDTVARRKREKEEHA
ncbi:MAG TPA: malto-oligosyltrehalose trehalohydrolase [Bryobacteraceae bacterium]|nr:malto-oligosyltrehalose trehalohydrolase [Bryobacteraceae bacterium]